MTIQVTGTTTITAAQILSPGPPIECDGGAGTVITLPATVPGSGATRTITVINKGTETQTVEYTDLKGRARSRDVKRGVREAFRLRVSDGRYSPDRGYEFSGDPADLIVPEEADEHLSRIGSDDIPLDSVDGTARAGWSHSPTDRPHFFGDNAIGWVDTDEAEGDIGAIAVRGLPLAPQEGIIISRVTVEIVSGTTADVDMPTVEGFTYFIHWRGVGGIVPPPAVSTVTVTLTIPEDVTMGQEVFIPHPDAFTELFVIIAGGASFGGGADAARDTVTIPTGVVARFWRDGEAWFVLSGAT